MGGLAFLSWALFPSLIMIIVGLLLLGICSGIMSSPLLTLLGDISRSDLQGRTLGIFRVLGDIGGVLGPIFGINLAEMFGFTVTYLVITSIMFVILLIILSLYRSELKINKKKSEDQNISAG